MILNKINGKVHHGKWQKSRSGSSAPRSILTTERLAGMFNLTYGNWRVIWLTKMMMATLIALSLYVRQAIAEAKP
jgi:hypothetical protein